MLRKAAIHRLDWLDPLKAFALLAIMLNHLVEEFGSGPWFTNPSDNWPNFVTRISRVFPTEYPFPISLVQFLGWLGDSGPGVFIFLSGFGLMWAALQRAGEQESAWSFYKRRLLRIFPLYITMHFVILTISLMSSSSELLLGSPMTLLSLLGLRFTDSLFFYINPSWWFVWLIVQLYILFPLLRALVDRKGVKSFLAITFGFTFLSRLLGLLGIRYSENLYYWMTGIFFGTRLAEFAVGMIAAVILLQVHKSGKKLPSLRKILVGSLLIYLLGLVSSFVWLGTTVSNLLVTVGMSGLFYWFWAGVIREIPFAAVVITWIGVESYGVYLLHQTPLIWTGSLLPGNSLRHLFSALLALIISFPAGWLVNKVVAKIQTSLKGNLWISLSPWTTWIVGIGVATAMMFLKPVYWTFVQQRAFSLVLGFAFLTLCLAESRYKEKERTWQRLFRWTVVFAIFFHLFVFTPRYIAWAFVAGGFCAASALVAFKYYKTRPIAWTAGLAVLVVTVSTLEFTLSHFAPLEAGRWGEYPALQKHPTRVYALKPNQVTRLKYNNYDYVIRTNSMGLASPEIDLSRPTSDTFRILVIGDAFSMPEGIEYKDSYPALLERELAKRVNPRTVQVINAGVTGYGPAEQFPQLRELVPLFKPNIVIYQFFINEFEEASILPEDRLRSIGLVESSISLRENIMGRSHLFVHAQFTYSSIKEFIKGDPDAWRYRKSLLDFYKTGENQYYCPANIEKLKSYLELMKGVCKETGCRFVIYFVPGAVAVSKPADVAYFPWGEDLSNNRLYDLERPLRTLSNIAASLNIPVKDLTSHLKQSDRQPVYFPESWHWNKQGHQVVAGVMAEDLIERGF